MKKTLRLLLLIFILFAILLMLFNWFNRGPLYELNSLTAEFTPVPVLPEGLTSLSAESCGQCHQAIFEEWKTSLHAKAYIDPFYLAYYKMDKYDPSCRVCHTPLEIQMEQLVSYENKDYLHPQYKKNPAFDKKIRDEGVTCAACHVRNGMVYGPYPASSLQSPHSVAYDPEYRSEKLCLRCHQVTQKKLSLVSDGICSTGVEFYQSHWFKKGYTCQTCHMESVERPLVPGFKSRKTGQHLWQGAFSKAQLKKAFTFSAQIKDASIWVTITNSGAGHKIPTGDPERYIKLSFYWVTVNNQQHLIKQIQFMREMIWKPILIEWTDNRLAPGESASFQFKQPESKGQLKVVAEYHVMSDWSYQRLQKHYQLITEWPIQWIFEDKFIAIDQ